MESQMKSETKSEMKPEMETEMETETNEEKKEEKKEVKVEEKVEEKPKKVICEITSSDEYLLLQLKITPRDFRNIGHDVFIRYIDELFLLDNNRGYIKEFGPQRGEGMHPEFRPFFHITYKFHEDSHIDQSAISVMSRLVDIFNFKVIGMSLHPEDAHYVRYDNLKLHCMHYRIFTLEADLAPNADLEQRIINLKVPDLKNPNRFSQKSWEMLGNLHRLEVQGYYQRDQVDRSKEEHELEDVHRQREIAQEIITRIELEVLRRKEKDATDSPLVDVSDNRPDSQISAPSQSIIDSQLNVTDSRPDSRLSTQVGSRPDSRQSQLSPVSGPSESLVDSQLHQLRQLSSRPESRLSTQVGSRPDSRQSQLSPVSAPLESLIDRQLRQFSSRPESKQSSLLSSHVDSPMESQSEDQPETQTTTGKQALMEFSSDSASSKSGKSRKSTESSSKSSDSSETLGMKTRSREKSGVSPDPKKFRKEDKGKK